MGSSENTRRRNYNYTVFACSTHYVIFSKNGYEHGVSDHMQSLSKETIYEGYGMILEVEEDCSLINKLEYGM